MDVENVSLSSQSLAPMNKRSRRISWSKNGFIAYASPKLNSKHNLYLTYLENIDGHSWQLSNPQGINIATPETPSFTPELVLVSWSNLSTDLAICDSQGNLYILLAGVGLLGNNKDISKISDTATANGNLKGKTPPPNNANTPSYELTSYNHTEMIYRDIVHSHPNTNLESRSQIICFKWLNIEKPQIVNKPASLAKHEGQNGQQGSGSIAYNFGVNQHQNTLTSHPISTKQACIALRENGEFLLYFQGEHKVEYHKLSAKVTDKDVSFTTGSFGFEGRKIIGSAYDSFLGTIITFSVMIDWGFLVEASKKQKVDPHYRTPKEAQRPPKLTVTHIAETKPLPKYNFEEKEKDVSDMEVDDGSNQPQLSTLKLSSIDIISPNFDTDSQLSILISYTVERRDTYAPKTLIMRFVVAKSLDIISEAFTDLGVRKNAAQEVDAGSYSLLIKDKITRSGQVQSIDTSTSDDIMMVTYEDGTIESFDRATLSLKSSQTKNARPPSTISTLFDVGFTFPEIPRKKGNPLWICISPNLSSVVYTQVNNATQKLSLKVMEKHNFSEITPQELYLTSVAFAFRHAYSCYTNTCADDLIALMQTEVQRMGNHIRQKKASQPHSADVIINRFIESIISESHKSINFQLDSFGKESADKLLSNPPLQKLLSLQLILGESQRKNFVVSDIAWIVLNLRSTSFGIMFTLSSIYRQISKKKPTEDTPQDSITRAESIMSLVGGVKWLIDLMIYLNQELMQLSYSKNNQDGSKLTYQNSIVLPILLSKVPRLFLMYAWSSIGKTHEILKKLHKDLHDSNKLFTPMKEALSRYFTICNTSPLNLSITENFLRECDAYVTKEVASLVANKDRAYSLKVEQKLVCQGELSEELVAIAKTLVERHTLTINRDLKVSDLFFYDVTWIDVGVTRSQDYTQTSDAPIIYEVSDPERRATPRLKFDRYKAIDALRKVVIDLGSDNDDKASKVRKCARCRSVSLMADPLIFDAPSTLGLWTMVFQRTCICGSAWVNCDQKIY